MAWRSSNTEHVRYLNNPEAMGGAAWFGLALISGSKLVLTLAVVRHLANWWFLRNVEKWVHLVPRVNVKFNIMIAVCSPHMRKLYGDSLRKDAGFVKVMKSVATKNARLLESRAGKHAPELKRVARDVKGTLEKVYEETADVFEEFFAKCMWFCSVIMNLCMVSNNAARPRISEVVQDTKILLQQSRERFVVMFVVSLVFQ